ncbi:MAG: prolipoprotein diacylglyceryl transferase family protein, partial [Chloroflexota bacterium]
IDAEPEWIRSMPFNAIILGLIGGRIVFSITHWEATLANPTSIIWPITFGYSLWGSVLTGLLAVAYSSKQQSVNPVIVLEALLEPILILLGAWVVADYLGGPGFGTRSPFDCVPIHPVQIYELFVIVMTFVIIRYSRRFKQFVGWELLLASSLLAFGFLITLNFRGGSQTILSGWQLNQLTAFGILILALAGLVYWSPNRSKESLTSS